MKATDLKLLNKRTLIKIRRRRSQIGPCLFSYAYTMVIA